MLNEIRTRHSSKAAPCEGWLLTSFDRRCYFDFAYHDARVDGTTCLRKLLHYIVGGASNMHWTLATAASLMGNKQNVARSDTNGF
jgi:hypothetical protein